MLVKIIALGLNATVWKNVFHHLRTPMPDVPFAAGIFSTKEEIAYLTSDFLPGTRPGDEVDFLLCDPGSGAEWKKRSAFLRQISGGKHPHHAQLALTLSTLEHGVKQLIQSPLRVELLMDGQARFTVTDPALIIRRFPADFPRLRLDDRIAALQLKGKAGTVREIQALDVPTGTLLGWNEIDSVVADGHRIEPLDWLKMTLRTEKIKWPHPEATGLMREPQGLYLCPGLPAGRITGIVVEGLTFPHLIDLGTLGGKSPQFDTLCQSVREVATRHQRRWQAVTTQTRHAESKRDLPLVCGGGIPLLRETLADRLTALGFARCSTLATPGAGVFREPALLLQVGPWAEEPDPGTLHAQLEEPDIVPLDSEMERIIEPLERLLPPGQGDWRGLPWRKVSPGDPLLTLERFEDKAAELADRRDKAASGLALAANRARLLTQELEVLAVAKGRLAGLLQADGTVKVWGGVLPAGAKQVLVFSHDPEEAGAVLQALPGIAKKRWFDLSPFHTADALQNLNLDPFREYAEKGVMVITSISREKLKHLESEISMQEEETRKALRESESARHFYAQEEEKSAAAAEALTRQWLCDATARWLDRHMKSLMERLDILRKRHERRWFSRALVNRVAIIPSSGENRPALLAACGEAFPGFKKDTSRVVHYDYDPQQELSAQDRKALRDSLGSEPPDPETWNAWQTRALEERNKAQLEAYLEVITNELGDFKADLLVIEQRAPVAFTILEHLRRELPELESVPAVVILPDYWEPEPNTALPWPHTRVVTLRRMGALGAEETTQNLRALYSA